MNQYVIFAGSNYYPNGGWLDFKGSVDTMNAALEVIANVEIAEWWHIVDTTTLEIVKKGRRV